MEIELRNERFSDYPETENVVREAFWNRYSPGCYEHYLIHIMRYSRAFVPQLDFVAVFDDKIVGNIVFLKSVIQADTGKEYEVLSLGPISVLPEYQNMGIGKRLIDHTRNLAKCMGFRAILLCGEPDYYLRRGFVPAETLGIRTADDMYADIYYYGYACGVPGSYVPKLPYRNLWTSILSVMYWIRTHENIYRIFQLF